MRNSMLVISFIVLVILKNNWPLDSVNITTFQWDHSTGSLPSMFFFLFPLCNTSFVICQAFFSNFLNFFENFLFRSQKTPILAVLLYTFSSRKSIKKKIDSTKRLSYAGSLPDCLLIYAVFALRKRILSKRVSDKFTHVVVGYQYIFIERQVI